ncbi:MAG: hypothetical protein ACJ74O_00320 [Frankiaceae bacterium]
MTRSAIRRSGPAPAARARRLLGAALLMAVPVLAACGGTGRGGSLVGAPQGPASATPSLPAASSTTGPGASGGPSGTVLPPVTGSRTITVTGTVEQGAEPSCLILRATTGQYELQGPLAARLGTGEQVTVTGHVVRDVMSHCMQGQPFAVTAVHGS